MNCLNILKLTF